LAQIRGIRRLAPQTELLELPDCGHSAHKDQPARVIQAVASFIGGLEKPR
jgi:pimeloyl-ACP methyl ester carboxylesterase